MKTIICIFGKSATGKDTIINALENTDLQIHKLVPVTTRPMRKNEIDGKNYIFINKDEFIHEIESSNIMEHRKYNTYDITGNPDEWYYGHRFPNDDLSIITGPLECYTNVVRCKDIKVIPIYLFIDNETRLYRAVTRESQSNVPNYKEMCRRFFTDEKDFSKHELHKAGIHSENMFLNENLNNTVHEIYTYIKKEIVL